MANLTTEQMLGNMRDKISQTFARQDGFYETMGVGTAVNLAGQQDRSNSDKFRTSGGTEDIATGTARLESIKGNAIAFNQLVQNGDFSDGLNKWTFRQGTDGGKVTNNNDGTLTVVPTSGTSSRCDIKHAISFNKGHKYYISYVYEFSGSITSIEFRLSYSSWNSIASTAITGSNGNVGLHTQKGFVEYNDSYDITGLFFTPRNAVNDSGDTFKFGRIMFFDLTLIYGEGNEPSTPEQFEADYKRWFGKELTYEDYDAGSLKPVLMTGYKTVGFNHLDPTTGKAHLVGTYGNTNVAQGLYCYEITGNYTTITDEDGNTITPNANGFFMVENPQEITVTGADENTCIHLTWSGWRNGETEAYWSDLSPIPVTTLTGKLNGEGESVVVFPDGMKSAGSVYDEIKVENGVVKAIKRIGSVNLGDVDWFTQSSDENNKGFRTRLNDAIYNFPNIGTPNMLTSFVPNRGLGVFPADDGVCSGWFTGGSCGVYITSVRHTGMTTTQFKTAMSGIMFYYELATPQEYVLDNFELPIRFKVDDFGTEEQIGEGVASILTLKYGVNAVDVLRRMNSNYISVESMDNFLAQLGVAMGGTWSRTWNESNQEYDFAFVPNSEPTPENATNQEEA